MIKSLLRSIIKLILKIIDKDHRENNEIKDDLKKFTHIENKTFKSDFGPASKIFRTVPYQMYKIVTKNKKIICADKHVFYTDKNKEVYADDISSGMYLMTNFGIEKVIQVKKLDFKSHCYCIQVDTDEHQYYANGFLSHNTTCAAAYLLWFATFRKQKTILIAANKLNQAVEILDRIKFSYERLPMWIKAGKLKFNERMVKFDNGSRIICRATTKDAGRGLSISLLYTDEFGIIPPNLSREFYTAIRPTLATGGKMIVTSTPMSDEDQFAELWFGSQNKFDENGNKIANDEGINGFYGLKYIWSDHPERDEKWAKEWKATMSEAKFRQEFCVEFISSDETLIDSTFLLEQMKGKPEKFFIKKVRWYAEPEANHIFGVALDPSMGTGGDSSAIQIFDLTTMTQIGEWKDNKTPTDKQLNVLHEILSYIYYELCENPYHKGEPEIYWTYENNGCGEAVNVAIKLIGEDKFPGTLLSDSNKRNGMNTTQKNKLTACSIFKRMVEKKKLTLNSAALISQLKGFVYSGGSYKAKSGMHDDLVMACILMIRLYEIVAKWEDNIADEGDLLEDDDDDDTAPMPIGIL